MPRNVLTPAEVDILEKRLRAEEVVPLTFFGSLTNAGNLTDADGDFASFQADKDYAIVAVTISAMIFSVTTALRGIALVSFSSTHNHTAAALQGDEIATLLFSGDKTYYTNFGGRNVYVEKNRTIYAHLHNESATGSSACKIQVFMLPVYKQ